MILEESHGIQQELYRKDEEFDRDRDLGHGPGFFAGDAKSRDERVIDELLQSAPRNQGYYLKLQN